MVINKIDGPSSIRAPQSVRRTAKTSSTSGSSFSKQLEETSEADNLGGTQGVVGVGSVSGILGIQEVDDALERAAKGKLRAEDILDRLEELRFDLLNGSLTRDKLLKLAHVVNIRRQEVTDPRLSSLLDEIDLRAQVELAKHDSLIEDSGAAQ